MQILNDMIMLVCIKNYREQREDLQLRFLPTSFIIGAERNLYILQILAKQRNQKHGPEMKSRVYIRTSKFPYILQIQ